MFTLSQHQREAHETQKIPPRPFNHRSTGYHCNFNRITIMENPLIYFKTTDGYDMVVNATHIVSLFYNYEEKETHIMVVNGLVYKTDQSEIEVRNMILSAYQS